jgi:hypothetical protein
MDMRQSETETMNRKLFIIALTPGGSPPVAPFTDDACMNTLGFPLVVSTGVIIEEAFAMPRGFII